MDLVIDAGNTLVKIGFFHNELLERTENVPSNDLHGMYNILSGLSFNHIILGSVISFPNHLLSYLKSKSKLFLMYSSDLPLPFKNSYSKSGGSDRLAMAAAAWKKYPHTNTLVIGIGSCITTNFISEKGVFSGGSISPGIQMRFKSLHQFTSALPSLIFDSETEVKLKGNTTEGSMYSGVINGILFEIKGFIQAYHKKYSSLKCIICGGDSRYIGEKLQEDIEIDPELVLYGLHSILNFNAEKKH